MPIAHWHPPFSGCECDVILFGLQVYLFVTLTVSLSVSQSSRQRAEEPVFN